MDAVLILSVASATRATARAARRARSVFAARAFSPAVLFASPQMRRRR